MEYPFKDLLPIDEVLEREGYYNDWTHLDPEVFYSLTQISEYIKTKGFGVDVRLLIAQLAEHFGLSVVEVTDIANELIARQDAVEGFNNQVIQEMTDKDVISAPEIIAARGGKPTLQARLDETTAQLAQTETDLITLNHRSAHISILEHIEDDGEEIDITDVLKTLIATLPENTTIYLPARSSAYVINEKIIIDREIFIKGDYSGRGKGTVIKARGDGGFEVRTSFLPIDGLDLHGVKDGVFEHRGHLGTIGIDMTLSSAGSSNGAHGHGVRVRDFNIGIAIRPVGDGTWAGAYRNFFNWTIAWNEVGVYAIDGATQNNFFGGRITNNTVHGVFTENDMYYSNLEFIGTILENNGTRSVNDMSYKEHGIYAGAFAKVKLTSAYVENSTVFACDGGMVLMVNTHVHSTVPMYAIRGGDVDVGNSLGAYEMTRTFSSGDQLKNAILHEVGVSSGGIRPSVSINMTDSESKVIRTKSLWFSSRGTPIQNIQLIKVRFKLKVDSAEAGEPFIRPVVNGETTVDNGDATLSSIPKNLYSVPVGSEVDFMFYYRPRVLSGYLSPDDTFANFQLTMLIPGDKSKKPFVATFSDVFIRCYSTSPLSLYDPTYVSG